MTQECNVSYFKKYNDSLFSVIAAVTLMRLWAADTLSPHADFTIYIMSHFDRPESFSHNLDLARHEWAMSKQQTTDEQQAMVW